MKIHPCYQSRDEVHHRIVNTTKILHIQRGSVREGASNSRKKKGCFTDGGAEEKEKVRRNCFHPSGISTGGLGNLRRITTTTTLKPRADRAQLAATAATATATRPPASPSARLCRCCSPWEEGRKVQTANGMLSACLLSANKIQLGNDSQRKSSFSLSL